MYIITLLYRERQIEVSLAFNCVFDFLNMLEMDKYVYGYKVCSSAGILKADSFGWGGMNKWKESLNG